MVNVTPIPRTMKNSAFIAGKEIASDQPFIVYSHTMGMLAEASSFEHGKKNWDRIVAACKERGREPDAMLMEWQSGHWSLCGSLYESHELSAGLPLVAF
jgi:hypothetical protein